MTETGRIPNFVTAEELNAPDVDPMALLNRGRRPVALGAIDEYVRIMHATVGSSRGYHQLGALGMFAAAIQHRWLPVTWAQRRKMRANVYGCILGRSTFDHKSTALSKIGETMPWDYTPNCHRLPGYFTEEGLYKELTEKPMGLIIRDEVGMLFASRNRKYTEFVVPFLTDAFGGWMNSKRLSSQSYQAREVALSIVGATTYSEFASTTTERDWDSGWLVRWLYAMPDDDYDPAHQPQWATPEDEAKLTALQNRLAQLSAHNASAMHIEKAASAHLDAWRRTLIHQAVHNVERHERVDAIIERYATYAWKFSMIVCAARGDAETVTAADAETATTLAENFMTNVHDLYQYQKAHRLTGSLMNRALGILNRHPEGLTRRELGRYLNNTNPTTRDPIINALLDIGAAMEETEDGKTRIVATQRKITVQKFA